MENIGMLLGGSLTIQQHNLESVSRTEGMAFPFKATFMQYYLLRIFIIFINYKLSIELFVIFVILIICVPLSVY